MDLHLVLGFEAAAPLMLLPDGLYAHPAAALVAAHDAQVIDESQSEQILFGFSFAEVSFAERAGFFNDGPFLDAEIAEGVTE